MGHPDHKELFGVTFEARRNKAIGTLAGILRGISTDGALNHRELELINNWADEHRQFKNQYPFSEIFPPLHSALSDGKLDADEVADLIWLLDRLDPTHGFYSLETTDMQRLHGLLGGIAADGVISVAELEMLHAWMSDHEHLQGYWPFDEIESLTTNALKDGHIDAQEHELLLMYFEQWSTLLGNRSLVQSEAAAAGIAGGICAISPEIIFSGRMFCLTGASSRGERKHIEAKISAKGGKPHPRVTKELHYLVIGDEGNPCWAFACYGRKVEAAMKLRQSGHPLVIVHDADLHDALS